MSQVSMELGSPVSQPGMIALRHACRHCLKKLILSHFFSHDKMPIDMNMLVFFLVKCVRSATKTMVVDRKT